MRNRSSLLFITAALFLILFAASDKVFSQAFTFARNLKQGDTGQDVLELQKRLNSDPRTMVTNSGAGSTGNETLFFGEMTRNAVKRYQEVWKDEILKPVGLDTGTGFVGESTRNHLNNGGRPQTPLEKNSLSTFSQGNPVITGVFPLHAMEGTEVALYGSGFAATNTVYASFDKLENIPSIDGKTIKFIVKEPFPDDLEVPDFIREDFKSMQYGFYIANKNGSSNTVMFTLDLIPQ